MYYKWLVILLATVLPTPFLQAQEKTDLEKRVALLEKHVAQIESIPLIAMALTAMDGGSKAEPAEPPQTDAPLVLDDWTYSFEKGEHEFQDKHDISYTLTNRTDKPIKLVDATIVFRDLAGEKIFAAKLLQDYNYPSGEAIKVSGWWPVPIVEPTGKRLSVIKHEDVKAQLIVRKVVFEDNSIWEAK
jgi:hypothetical protein